MSILLEVQRYKHYNLLQEAYIPREIEYAITEDKRYMIIENELFDINQNKSLGLYYESRLLKEEIITESWFETIADIGIGISSAALAATGVGAGAAMAIDVLHGISFIYRGETRNDNVLKVMGYFSVALAAIPGLGPWMKGVLVNVVKKFIGKPIASLLKAMAKNPTGLKAAKVLQGAVGKLAGKVGQFNNWAKQYKWFDKIWSKVGKSFEGGIKYFDDFLKGVTGAAAKTGQKALPSGAAKAGQLVVVKNADDVIKMASSAGVKIPAELQKQIGKLVGKNGLTKAQFKALLSGSDDVLTQVLKLGKRFKGRPEVLSSALRKIAEQNPALRAKVAEQAAKIAAVSPGKIFITQSAKSLRNAGQVTLRKGQEMIKVIKWPKIKTGNLKIIDISFKEVIKKPNMFKQIPNSYKYAAALLAGVGLGSLISDDDETYVIYDDKIIKSYKESGGVVEGETDTFGKSDEKTDTFGKSDEKTAKAKKTNPNLVTDYDRAWDYLKKGGKYYTRRKGNSKWIHVTPEMKGGKPYNSIKTNVFKD